MSSAYSNPNAYFRWKSTGQKIELFNINPNSEGIINTAVDESNTEGLLVICEATPEFIDVADDDLGAVVPEMADSVYPQLIDYIRYRLLQRGDSEISHVKARQSKKDFEAGIYQKDGGKIKDNSIHIMVPDLDGSVL